MSGTNTFFSAVEIPSAFLNWQSSKCNTKMVSAVSVKRGFCRICKKYATYLTFEMQVLVCGFFYSIDNLPYL